MKPSLRSVQLAARIDAALLLADEGIRRYAELVDDGVLPYAARRAALERVQTIAGEVDDE